MTWPDPVKFFLPKIAEGLPHKVAQNPAALRAAVFLLSAKNLRGGGLHQPPPVRARVKTGSETPLLRNAGFWPKVKLQCFRFFLHTVPRPNEWKHACCQTNFQKSFFLLVHRTCALAYIKYLKNGKQMCQYFQKHPVAPLVWARKPVIRFAPLVRLTPLSPTYTIYWFNFRGCCMKTGWVRVDV